MASASDARIGIAKETTYGTRVAPARFLPLTAEDNGFNYNRYFSPAIGLGPWQRPSIVTTASGTGSISGDVPTTGFGYLLDGLHPNSVSPVQVGATAAYLQTHTLDGAPSKSYSMQVQMPPVTSSTLLPHDLLGVMFGGITLSWAAAGVFSYNIPTVIRDLDLTQSLATYTPPSAYALLPFQGGSVTIGGSLEGNIVGDGSVTITWPLRDDAFALGTTGRMAKPVPTDKPTAELAFTADFVDNANINRTINNTVADVVVKFQHPTAIAGTNFPYLEVTLQDCVFTTGRPTVSGTGPLSQSVSATAASATGDPPIIKYQSVDTLL
jgi:hypothetical protein